MIREVCILTGYSVLLLVCADARTRCTYIVYNADSLFLEFYSVSIYDTIYLRFCQYIVYLSKFGLRYVAIRLIAGGSDDKGGDVKIASSNVKCRIFLIYVLIRCY
jgi:hypothetical protein